LNRRFRELIEERPEFSKKPVFAFLHTIDPHDPYTPKSPFLKFKKDDPNREHLCFPKEIFQKKKKSGLSQEDLDYIQSLYDCEILHNDYFFGEWITFLKEKKLFDNSLIIFVSDHGEQFHEHGGMFHGHSIYNEEVHVPLIVKFPGGRYSGRQCSAAVSQVDILPTILDYLGIDMPAGIDGISLLDLVEDHTIKRSIFIKEELEITHMLGFIDSNREKNIFTYQDGLFDKPVKYETFNLLTDFHETDNLFEKMGLFRAKSIEFLADYFSIEMNAAAYRKEAEVDIDKLAPDVLKQLKALGYLE
jgi:arylsulfatase A-like enzyme